ncbi:phage head closure protein [Lutibaculum baratangense]|nr:phage head closure protein [Lutibaculum baratangense]ESR25254.1 putative phage head-tail adaptor [Lutibaculum baratangense AMV1]
MELLTMRAGDMDRRIIVSQPGEIIDYDPFGSPIYGDPTEYEVWAHVSQQSGREFFAAGGIQSSRMVVFRLRWIDGITVLDTVKYGGRDHNIQEVRELGRKEGLELHTITSG